jgi:hypothetical protein
MNHREHRAEPNESLTCIGINLCMISNNPESVFQKDTDRKGVTICVICGFIHSRAAR